MCARIFVAWILNWNQNSDNKDQKKFTKIVNVCPHYGPSLPFMLTHHTPHELSRPVPEPETAVETDRTHRFSNANLHHLAITNIIVGGLDKTGSLLNICVKFY